MYEIFEQLLQKNNVTPYKVSKETGIATATLSDWKNGKSTPKQDKLQKIADYFGISVDQLMGRSETTNNTNEFLDNLNDLLIMYPDESVSVISEECKKKRIYSDLTERYVSNQANVSLEKYLEFENGKFIGAENLLNIISFLEIDYGYLYGLVVGKINNGNKDLPELLNDLPLKDSTKQIAIFMSKQDPDTIMQIMKETFSEKEIDFYLRLSAYAKQLNDRRK